MVAIYRLLVGTEYGKIRAPLVFLLQTLPGSFLSHTNQIAMEETETALQQPTQETEDPQTDQVTTTGGIPLNSLDSLLQSSSYSQIKHFHHDTVARTNLR